MTSNCIGFRDSVKQISGIAIPIAVTRIINSANIFIGMLFIASLGTSALAAGAIVSSTYTAILLVGMGVLFSSSILMGQALGQKNIASIGPIVHNALTVAFLLGLCGAAIMFNVGPLLLSMGQDPEVASMAQHYFNYAAFGLCPCLGGGVLNQFVITIGKPKFAMLSILMTVPFNALLGYGLLFGKFGLPSFGMSGIAIAIATNFWLSFVIMLVYVSRNKAFAAYQLFKNWSVDRHLLKSIFSLGWPISAQFAIELGAYAVAAMMMGLLSVDALAAQQIVIQSSILAGIIPFSLAQGASILISKQMGQKNLTGVKIITRHGLVLVGLVSAVIALLFLTCANGIIALYIQHDSTANEAQVAALAKTLLSMFALTQLIDCLRNMLGSSLTGLQRSRLSMLASFVSCWLIALPGAYIAMFYFNLGPVGMPVGFQIGFLIGLALSAVLFARLTAKASVDKADLYLDEAEAV